MGNPYKYRQGHCQVSSFGVGGTNGHAVFWGEKKREVPDVRRQFLRKMTECKGQILADGNDPANWEFSGLSFKPELGVKYSVVYSKDPLTNKDTITYEKQAETI